MRVNGCSLWLRADRGVVLNGTTVSRWIDQSGNGNDAVQATAGNQPNFINTSIGGYPALNFTAAGKWMDVVDNATTQTQNGTIFLALKQNTAQTAHIIGSGDMNNDRNGAVIWCSNANPTGEIGNATTFERCSFGFSFALGVPIVLAYVFDSSASRIMTNGLLNGSNVARSLTIAWNAYPLRIGNASNGVSRFFVGDIAEIIYYNTALGELDRRTVENYLNHKYSIFL